MSINNFRGRDYVFHSRSKKLFSLFSYSLILFVGLAESSETSESEPSNFRVMNIPEKPQTAVLSSLNNEVWSDSPFCLPCLQRSLVEFILLSAHFIVHSHNCTLMEAVSYKKNENENWSKSHSNRKNDFIESKLRVPNYFNSPSPGHFCYKIV